MSWVRVIVAIDHARNDDLQWRLSALHHADLDGRGMGAQHHLRRNEEGVLHLAGRVIGGNVEGGEVVVVVLDVRTTGDLESHCHKDGDSLIEHLQQGMQRTAWPLTARNSNIDTLGSE